MNDPIREPNHQYWKGALDVYRQRLQHLRQLASLSIDHHLLMPYGPRPATEPFHRVEGALHRSLEFFNLGCWHRSRSLVESLTDLWYLGRFSDSVPIARLIYELWAASHYLRTYHEAYLHDGDFDSFTKVVDKFFEGARSDVLMFYGEPAKESPVHTLDFIRHLAAEQPNAKSDYDFLCESCHPNLPRYIEWYVIEPRVDNWKNETASRNGHRLLDRTLRLVDQAVSGSFLECKSAYEACDKIYLKYVTEQS